MRDPLEQTDAFGLIEAIAVALRARFATGEHIEEQPGFRDPAKAGQVNRAFRVVVRTILRRFIPPEDDLAALTNQTLARLARRLDAELLDAREVEHLLGLEPADRDDWLVFLILTPASELEHLLETREPDDDHDRPAAPLP